MSEHDTSTVRFSSPVRYEGNLFFLILFLVLFLPIGILLLMRNGYFIYKMSRFGLKYDGSWGWLYFWGALLFPVAILLLIFKGVDIVERPV